MFSASHSSRRAAGRPRLAGTSEPQGKTSLERELVDAKARPRARFELNKNLMELPLVYNLRRQKEITKTQTR